MYIHVRIVASATYVSPVHLLAKIIAGGHFLSAYVLVCFELRCLRNLATRVVQLNLTDYEMKILEMPRGHVPN